MTPAAAQAALAALNTFTACEHWSHQSKSHFDAINIREQEEHLAKCPDRVALFPDEREVCTNKAHAPSSPVHWASDKRHRNGCPGYSVREPNIGRLMKGMRKLGMFLAVGMSNNGYEAVVDMPLGKMVADATDPDPNAAAYEAAYKAATLAAVKGAK